MIPEQVRLLRSLLFDGEEKVLRAILAGPHEGTVVSKPAE